MAVVNQKSAQITNLDAIPVVPPQAGINGPGRLQEVDGFVTIPASLSTGSVQRMVRVPTNAKIKAVTAESEAQGAGKFNCSVYYSDATNDGTPAANQGIIVPSTGDQFFAADLDCASAVNPTNITNQSGNYNLSKRNKELWDALGLATDPGGFFDICFVCHTTAVTTGTGRLGLRVTYVM